jgi:hypothetical protein
VTERRTFNTPLRAPWNPVIYQCLKAVDCHNEEYFRSGDEWHLRQAQVLRDYVIGLKDWLSKEEKARQSGL